MSIIDGKEKEWLKMMLEAKYMLETMGLPIDMTDEEKKFLIETIDGFDDIFSHTNSDFNEIDKQKPNDMSPCDWMIQTALVDMKLTENTIDIPTNVGSEIQGNDLTVNNFYLLTFPNGNEATVRLNRILKNSFGDDYIFENFGGADKLAKLSNSQFVSDAEFPFPSNLFKETKFNILI